MVKNQNMSRIDRIVRLLIAIAVLCLALLIPEFVNNIIINSLLLIFGVINIFSAVTAFCPVYKLADISTLRKQ